MITHVTCSVHGFIPISLCYAVKTPQRTGGYRYYCKECHQTFSRLEHLLKKISVLNRYGARCRICDTTDVEFLCLDHIDNNGAAFRKLHKGNIYRLLEHQEFPGLQVLCGNCNAIKQTDVAASRALDNAKATQTREYRLRVKQETLAQYGGTCACCGESTIGKLTIDHPNGDGSKERRQLGLSGGFWFYKHLRDAGYPSGYRVLCFNCNVALGHYGYCPHHGRPPRIEQMLASANPKQFALAFLRTHVTPSLSRI
jgi:hypothetical protein